MKSRKLYLFILCAVLLSACGNGGEHADSTSESATTTTDTLTRTTGEPQEEESSAVILFLGNSLSAGLGVDEADSFPARIDERIDSLGWDFRVVNAGLSGETTSGGLRRVDWLLEDRVDVLVLELGGNDGLRGVPVEVARDNLRQIIEKTRAAYPDVTIVLAGMQIPPNLGHDYTQRFRAMYPELAESENTHLIPFLLEDVGGVDSLMQGDGIHPTADGHRVVADNVWDVLGPILQDLRADS